MKEGSIEYEGEFLDDKKNGIGNLSSKEFKYQGEFKNDEIEGQGTMTW